ncbi:Sodium/hydrogen exchanger, partial [Caligus rogercresseyi]
TSCGLRVFGVPWRLLYLSEIRPGKSDKLFHHDLPHHYGHRYFLWGLRYFPSRITT